MAVGSWCGLLEGVELCEAKAASGLSVLAVVGRGSLDPWVKVVVSAGWRWSGGRLWLAVVKSMHRDVGGVGGRHNAQWSTAMDVGLWSFMWVLEVGLRRNLRHTFGQSDLAVDIGLNGGVFTFG